MNIAITGASQGIGLELTKQAVERGDHVFVFVRQPETAEGLQGLRKKFHDQLIVDALDLAKSDMVDTMASLLERMPTIDILVNNAGVYLKEESLDAFLTSFQVNAIAPFLLTRAFFPNLKKSKKPIVAHITSLMGSIGDNQSGGSYAYRASKAALNMISKTLSRDERWLISAVIHPGWVKTRMGGEDAMISATESVRGIWKVIGKLQAADSGKFYDYEGDKLLW